MTSGRSLGHLSIKDTLTVVQCGNICVDNTNIGLVSWSTLYNVCTHDVEFFVCDVNVNFLLAS